MKVHLSLATSDLDASVAFYATLLDREPAKILPDYALFVAEDPGIELALALADRVAPASDAHFGICVASADDVERAIVRLTERGLAKSIERDQTCCYAKQTKVWTADPEGRRWEVYTVLEETPAQNGPAEDCCVEPCGCAA